MKKILLPLLLITSTTFMDAQSTTYGTQLDTATNLNFFISVDPATAVITQIDTLPNNMELINGTETINGSSEFYIFIANNPLLSSPIDYIYTVDINTGNILSNPAISSPVMELNYDKVNDTYYAIEKEDTSTGGVVQGSLSQQIYFGTFFLSSVNPTTGLVTRIDTIPGVNEVATNNSAYNSTDEEFVFVGNEGSIFTVDVNTGDVISSPLLSADILELQFNLNTGTFYAIEIDAGIHYLVSVNTNTGVVTRINSIAGLTDIKLSTSTLDTINGWYEINDSSNKRFSIDINTATVVSSPQLNSAINNLTINVISVPEPVNPLVAYEVKSSNLTFDNPSKYKTEWSNTFEKRFQAYPNPANNQLTLEVNNIPATLNIYNQNGVLIKTEVIIERSRTVDVSNYMEGLYFFSINNVDFTETKKILVQ